ncbi:hypothetical protein N7489_008361 [Penicillium chrysogenum]|uniref:uncharacterized protein n=1 Tax=Penicillium chrysogenum TaxID=5076 RepID=UPI0024DF0A56|nr:uncharacterized protein N7489_008361 [Penicillium chrysogenum]KAJ5238270.1 hypothetical protein N7489_008361 [Penicillium chrysogenum]
MQHLPLGYNRDGRGRTGRTFSEDLLVTIVVRACATSRLNDSILSGEYSNDSTYRLQSDKACLEEKIKTIYGLDTTARVAGIKVQARKTGLKLVTEALEAFE